MGLKKQTISFLGPDALAAGIKNRNNELLAFDWDLAAKIIKERLPEHPDLVAEAGLQPDFDYTGGIIFVNGKPTNDNYTYLASTWATPTLILSWGGKEREEHVCQRQESDRFNYSTKWDMVSLGILGITI